MFSSTFLQGQGRISGHLCSRGEWKVLRTGRVLSAQRPSGGFQHGASWTAPSEAAEDLLRGAAQEGACTHLPSYSLCPPQMYFISVCLSVGGSQSWLCVCREVDFRGIWTEGQDTEAVNIPAFIFFLVLLRNQGVWWSLWCLTAL